jgi:hypothetical protein
MALLDIAEIFGHALASESLRAKEDRRRKWCPFRGGPCNKGNLKKPLGICSFTDGARLGCVCPNRFVEDQRAFRDVGRLAFGSGVSVVIAPEIRILRIPGQPSKRIGKVDYILSRLDASDDVCDFAAVEVQAAYISGRSVRPAFEHYLQHGALPKSGAGRRVDYRSSVQKRLVPQLSLKVPVFRRWGKKFFVVVDSMLFEQVPRFKTVDTIQNSEVTWLVYPFQSSDGSFRMGDPTVLYSVWEDVMTSLREGREPTPVEILDEIRAKKKTLKRLTI